MRWVKAMQLAAVYVGSVVGAGFATGKEIVEFFSKYGSLGILGILIAGWFFIFLGNKIMVLAIRINAKSYQQMNEYIFGNTITPLINIIMLIMLIGVSAVMFSGAGSLFEEQLNIPKNVGVLLTMILAFIVFLAGTKGVMAVNVIVVPLLIFFSLLLFYLSTGNQDFYINLLDTDSVHWRVVISAVSYAAFNLSLTQAVLVPAAAEIGDEKVVKAGGIMGGVILTVVLLASHMTLVQLPDLASYHIPMAMIMGKLAPSLFFLFILVIYGEIFTSIIGNIYGLERFIRKKVKISSVWIGVFIFTLCYFISKADYGDLLSSLYPLFGYIGLAYLVLLSFKKKE